MDGVCVVSGGNIDAMWGAPQLGRWKWHDPNVHINLLIGNNTRLWLYAPVAMGCSDPAAMADACDQAQGSSRTFYAHYRAQGGGNGHFDFPTSGEHDWGYWSAQLSAMANDVAAAIK